MFLVNVNYKFKIDSSIKPEGSIIPAVAMPLHELERRKLPSTDPAPKGRRPRKVYHPHLLKRLFDPQLYLAGLDASKSKKHCAILASYPWFGAHGLDEYDSGVHKQSVWRTGAKSKVADIWPGQPPSDSDAIEACVKSCVDFQVRNGMWGVILPSPLTSDPTSSYSLEVDWLDAGLDYLKTIPGFNKPVFATVALSDLVIYGTPDPSSNALLDAVLDTVSAREVHGVYIVIEQFLEGDDKRHCESDRTLRSLLHLVHRFGYESKLEVGVNFIGAFGVACEAAGASWWASHWYKSLHRIRLADKLAGGRSYPLYWSAPSALDINLENDFDILAKKGLPKIADRTAFSEGLLAAAKGGKSAKDVPEWAYRQSNCTDAMNHYLESAIQMEAAYAAQPAGRARADYVESWLSQCAATAQWAGGLLGSAPKTALGHPSAWLKAFQAYRKDHRV